MRTELSTEAAVSPREHAPGQPLADERALEEEGDHGSAEVSGEPGEIEGGDMNESTLAIEAAFQENAVEVGVEPDEVSRRGVGDHGGTLNPPTGSLVGEALDHAVDESADLTEEGAVVTEEDAQHLGECEDHLPVGEAKQELFVHVLAEEQCVSGSRKDTNGRPCS